MVILADLLTEAFTAGTLPQLHTAFDAKNISQIQLHSKLSRTHNMTGAAVSCSSLRKPF